MLNQIGLWGDLLCSIAILVVIVWRKFRLRNGFSILFPPIVTLVVLRSIAIVFYYFGDDATEIMYAGRFLSSGIMLIFAIHLAIDTAKKAKVFDSIFQK